MIHVKANRGAVVVAMSTISCVGDFEWDRSKEAANPAQTYGVSFVEAMSVFLDPRGISPPPTSFTASASSSLVARTGFGYFFVVSAEAADERIRIISARKASRAQRKSVPEHGPK